MLSAGPPASFPIRSNSALDAYAAKTLKSKHEILRFVTGTHQPNGFPGLTFAETEKHAHYVFILTSSAIKKIARSRSLVL